MAFQSGAFQSSAFQGAGTAASSAGWLFKKKKRKFTVDLGDGRSEVFDNLQDAMEALQARRRDEPEEVVAQKPRAPLKLKKNHSGGPKEFIERVQEEYDEAEDIVLLLM